MPRLEPPQLAAMGRPRSMPRRLADGSLTSRGDIERSLGETEGKCGDHEDLEGEPSPWETRATHRWKRRWVATDSSAEKSPEVSCSTGAALTMSSGNRRGRRCGTLSRGTECRVERPRSIGSSGSVRSVGSSSRRETSRPPGHGAERDGGRAGRLAGLLEAPIW